MKRLFIALLIASSAFAEEEVPPPAPKIESYELKNRSKFTLDREGRVPFWPIGWVKIKSSGPNQPRVGSQVALAAKKKFEIQPQHFSVTSVLVGRPALATINGRSFAEGEVLPVISGAERLRVVLKAVRDGGVWLEHGERQIYVPIRRAEVNARPVEQQPQSSEFSINIGG